MEEGEERGGGGFQRQRDVEEKKEKGSQDWGERMGSTEH